MRCFSEKYESPLGSITIIASNDALKAVLLTGQKQGKINSRWQLAQIGNAITGEARRWLEQYFAGHKSCECHVKIEPEGSAYCQKIWAELQKIPYGTCISYGQLAARIDSQRHKAGARAAGQATGNNPISIFIPCHRVVRANGALGGYDGGTYLKAWLLHHEGATIENCKLMF